MLHLSVMFDAAFLPTRIYYINLDHRTDRRAFMETWLRKQPVPWERVPAQVGFATCHRKSAESCKGVTGLTLANLHILESRNTSGLTLVLEDDVYVDTRQLLELVAKHVPEVWDVIRSDCWGRPLRTFRWVDNITFRTDVSNSSDEFYCGGTHAVLWHHAAVPKLRRVWQLRSDHKYAGIDCRLNTAFVPLPSSPLPSTSPPTLPQRAPLADVHEKRDPFYSYCLQARLAILNRRFGSSIPKDPRAVRKQEHYLPGRVHGHTIHHP